MKKISFLSKVGAWFKARSLLSKIFLYPVIGIISAGVLFLIFIALMTGLKYVNPEFFQSNISSTTQRENKSYMPEIQKSNCDSNFNDEKWYIDKRWKRSKENPHRFIAEPQKEGGPKMTYHETVSDNFHLILDFSPITNEKMSKHEINLVVYVGSLYKLVLGDGNRDSFSVKDREDNYVAELTKDMEGRVPLPNEIAFDKWVEIEIRQYVPLNSKTRNIAVSFYYTPAEIENAQPISESYFFQIEDDALPEKVSREISIGLLHSENSIITEFHCFKIDVDR